MEERRMVREEGGNRRRRVEEQREGHSRCVRMCVCVCVCVCVCANLPPDVWWMKLLPHLGAHCPVPEEDVEKVHIGAVGGHAVLIGVIVLHWRGHAVRQLVHVDDRLLASGDVLRPGGEGLGGSRDVGEEASESGRGQGQTSQVRCLGVGADASRVAAALSLSFSLFPSSSLSPPLSHLGPGAVQAEPGRLTVAEAPDALAPVVALPGAH